MRVNGSNPLSPLSSNVYVVWSQTERELTRQVNPTAKTCSVRITAGVGRFTYISRFDLNHDPSVTIQYIYITIVDYTAT